MITGSGIPGNSSFTVFGAHRSEMVKVRFAPSPTGNLHVGNAKTALINYLFAKENGGIFVLRMEDTDLTRSDVSYERSIMEDLGWLGISWDEGPYRQSERTGIYRSHAQKLLEAEDAYKCFCTEEELSLARRRSLAKGEPPRYNGKCRGLSGDGIARLEREGRPFVVRFRSPLKPVSFHDGIRGNLFFPRDHVDDLIILRQDGTPTYNLAVVVDDMLMGITHVIRGGDHISNTPKQIALFEALGGQPPHYAHHSLLIGADRKPLSKRHGATRVIDFRSMGILSGALANYLCTMGRSVAREVMDLNELIQTFSLDSLSGADNIFDMEKLLWFNREHLKHMPIEELLGAAGLPGSQARPVLAVRENASTLEELKEYMAVFDEAVLKEDALAYLKDMVQAGQMGRRVKELLGGGRTPSFEDLAGELKQQESLKRKDLFMVLRAFITGRTDGPPLKDIFPLIPADIIRRRIDVYLNLMQKNEE